MASNAIKDCWESTILRISVGNEGGGGGAQTKGVFAKTSIDSCTKA